jgi:hypothetical protein
MSFIPVSVNEVETEAELPSLTYKIDWEAGRIVGKVDGLEAVAQAIKKALLTPRFKCLIYDNQYGSEIADAITAGDTTPELLEAEMPRLVEDAVLADSRVLEISDFTYRYDGDAAHIAFTAYTIFGNLQIESVVG